MGRISPEAFLQEFAQEWEKQNAEHSADIIEKSLRDKAWTEFMLDKEHGFLQNVMDRLGAGCVYQREWYTVDALYVAGPNLLDREGLGYPAQVHVLIEHENGCNVDEEMWKLIHWRSPLKVIILYDWSEERKRKDPRKDTWLSEKLNKLRSMLEAVNGFWQEKEETEYLFVIGRREAEGSERHWWWASHRSLELKPLTWTTA